MKAATWLLTVKRPGLLLTGIGLVLIGIGHGLRVPR